MTEKENQQSPVQDEHMVEELTESIHELEERLEKVNKPSRHFFVGMFSGLGGAIGATLLLGLLIGLFSWLSNRTESFPRLNDFITSINQEIKQ